LLEDGELGGRDVVEELRCVGHILSFQLITVAQMVGVTLYGTSCK
jgi:hypothetical protein